MNSSVINDIQNNFVKEATNSPLLISDLANMEKYIAESYSGRSLIELLQNADDANSDTFRLEKISDKCYIVANNGRIFTADDILSICRSGASSKKRKTNTIGYRGIGFKSVVNYSESVHIISGEVELTFSRELTKKLLPSAISVPLIRIPHLLLNCIYIEKIRKLKELGFCTFFIFEANTDGLTMEIEQFSSSVLLFLNNIKKIEFISDNKKSVFAIKRKRLDVNKQYAELKMDNLLNRWIIKNDNQACAIAFQVDSEKKLIKLTNEESVIHSFMPTNDIVGLPIKINGDFSTDPSRTNVINDEETTEVLDNCALIIADMVVEIIVKSSDEHNFMGIFEDLYKDNLALFRNQKISDLFLNKCKEFFNDKFEMKLATIDDNSKKIGIQPKWISSKDFQQYCHFVKIIGFGDEIEKEVTGVINFLMKAGYKYIDLEDVLISSKTLNFSLKSKTMIFAHVINQFRFNMSANDKEVISNANFIEFDTGSKSLAKTKPNDKLDNEFLTNLLKYVNDERDIFWFLSKFNLYSDNTGTFKIDSGVKMTNTEKNTIKTKMVIDNDIFTNNASILTEFKSKPVFQKWRSVEENVVIAFESMENVIKVTDVSKSNLGYDIEVIMNDGIRYVEVKSVQQLGDSFSLTNNEYSTAVEYGERYGLAVVEQVNDLIEICIMFDPIKKLSLFKRVTRWEWVCNEYIGNKFTFKI